MASKNLQIETNPTGWREGGIVFHDFDHTPSNKRRWEIHKSTCVLTIKDYNGRKPKAHPHAWTEIHLEETTQAKEGGNFQTRQISLTLDAAGRAALRDYLDRREAMTWGEGDDVSARPVKFYIREGAADPFAYVDTVAMPAGNVAYEAVARERLDIVGSCEVMALTPSGHAYTFFL